MKTLTESNTFAMSFGRRVAVTLVVLASASALLGCLGALMQKPPVTVEAEYRGLENKRIAVLVSADEKALYQFPRAQIDLGRAVSAKIAQTVPGVVVTDPNDIARFQKANPYWNTVPYGKLLKQLNAERLIYFDLAQYTTHEPGNAHVWQGVVLASMGIAESDSEDPDNLSYYTNILARYPTDRPVGLLQSDDKTIQLGMLQTFAQKVANKFQDHQIIPK